MKLPRRYWDSSCFLAWLKPEPERRDACREVLQAAEKRELQIVTSAISLTEVIKLNKGPVVIPQEHEQKIRDFFKQEYIVIVQVTRLIAEEARSLIWRFPALRPKDALHAATALYGGVEDLDTFDKDFLPLDGHLGAHRLRIRQPHMPQPNLPFDVSGEPPVQKENSDIN